MKPEDLALIRQGAEIQNFKPYIDDEVASMQKAVVNSVLGAVNSGTLTPEMALSKWMEYIAYLKLNQKFDQKIKVGQSVGGEQTHALDFRSKNQ